MHCDDYHTRKCDGVLRPFASTINELSMALALSLPADSDIPSAEENNLA